MKILSSFFVIVVFIISACSGRKKHTYHIGDFKDTTFYFKASNSMPNFRNIAIRGYSNDSFIVGNLTLHGGKIDTLLSSEYYKDTVYITFKPYKATGGYLILDCEAY
jgi:hypothetical protein